MKVVSGLELFETFSALGRAMDGLKAITDGVCPTCGAKRETIVTNHDAETQAPKKGGWDGGRRGGGRAR